MTADPVQLFKAYCRANITERAAPLTEAQKTQIVQSLLSSPFHTVAQAWMVLDFYDYKLLHAEGFDTYYGFDNRRMTAESMLEIVHPDDREAFSQLYYLCLEGLLHSPSPVKNIGHFCISYRIQNAHGEYVKVLETNSIIESDEEKNIPLVCLSQMTNINHLDQSARVTYYFRLFDDNDANIRNMASYLSAYNSPINVFTETELKIATLLKNGLTSQQVAERIYRSKHTVDKYRKQLLQKTQTANTAGLITHMSGLNLI